MRVWIAVLALGLAACGRAGPQPVPVVPAPVGPVDLTPGLVEREPDTCRAGALVGLVGQGSASLRTVAVPGPVRLVAPGQVVDQEEYRSDRINAYLDDTGVITGFRCG